MYDYDVGVIIKLIFCGDNFSMYHHNKINRIGVYVS